MPAKAKIPETGIAGTSISETEIAGLRRRVAKLETGGAVATLSEDERKSALSLGPALDGCFTEGGLGCGSHQIAAGADDPFAARTFGFMLMARYLLAHPATRALVIQEASALREMGAAYGPGLHALGLDPGRLIFLQTSDAASALRAVNEALRARTPEMLFVDLWAGAQMADLSVTRRFNLAAEKAKAMVLLATPDLSATSAALTRWRVASAPSAEAKRRVGLPAFHLELVRNRHGRTGRWTLAWNSHEHVFQSVKSGPDAAFLAPPPLDASVVPHSLDRSGAARTAAAGFASGAYRQAG